MLYYNTVSPLLKSSLEVLMKSEEFQSFILVGGTALSLYLGHRMSIDIDLFSDAEYGSIDFEKLEAFLKNNFEYVDYFSSMVSFGKSYSIGTDKNNSIKLDVFYTDSFIKAPVVEDSIRLASLDDIVAMKLDVVQRNGRKKDFWDLHHLFEQYSIEEMIQVHEKRYPFTHEKKHLLSNFINFELADQEFDPICLKEKYWELIKLDFEDKINEYKTNNNLKLRP
ncbi:MULTISPECIES: nucleotidyl transferase AbiEii/AbiGii toxin family protein [Chryseobacterium]|uniref:Nucleotidyl transferase AbiEii toxin, Type IV TA system n=2 Tax=Chryseobacterium TaxID=59732 RepID=A0A6N4XD57_9FLAO|nr:MULTISPECIES: nucleotidyl transferase AbiEii/AbiGii toxin family protein [Chryseobacterium]CAA7197633.1 hypothetical protein CHRY9293_03706 [Chryseobacterium potabilaquae]CAA7392502.1 hypothetical protein CHRY9393_03222 [Chryseobacterium fistulae]